MQVVVASLAQEVDCHSVVVAGIRCAEAYCCVVAYGCSVGIDLLESQRRMGVVGHLEGPEIEGDHCA